MGRTARSLDSLAVRRRLLGRYEQAEILHLRAVALADRCYRATPVAVWPYLNNLGVLYKFIGRFEEARSLYDRAFRLVRLAPTRDLSAEATIHHNIGGVEHARGRPGAAEPHARRAVEIRTRLRGPGHPDTAADLAALAAILTDLGRLEEAEAALTRVLIVLERAGTEDLVELAAALHGLATIRHARSEFEEAAGLYVRALEVKERSLGRNHPELASTLNGLALVRKQQLRFGEAEWLYGRALDVLQRSVDPDHPHLSALRANQAALQRAAVSRPRG